MKRFYLVVSLVLPFLFLGGAYVLARGFHNNVLWAEPALMEFYLNHILNGQVWYVGTISNGPFYHLGPSLMYLFTPIYWLGGKLTSSMYLGALLLNAGCILWLTRYLEKLPVISYLIVALGILWAGPSILVDPSNAWVNVIPFGLFLFMVANLADGHNEELPWVTLLGSFLLQCHYGMGFALVALVITAVIFNSSVMRAKYLGLSLLILVVMWILPIIEEVTAPAGEGNMSRIIQHYLTSKPSPRTLWESVTVFSQYMVLPVKYLPKMIAGWPESFLLLLIQESALVWATFKSYQSGHSYVVCLGVLCMVATGVAFLSLLKVPTPLVAGWYIWWVWGIAVGTLCVIGSALLFPMRIKNCEAVILLATIVVGLWPLFSDPNEWPPRTDKEWIREKVAKLPPNPNIYFPKNAGGEATSMALLLYKNGKPFTLSGLGGYGNYNWPLGLQSEYEH